MLKKDKFDGIFWFYQYPLEFTSRSSEKKKFYWDGIGFMMNEINFKKKFFVVTDEKCDFSLFFWFTGFYESLNWSKVIKKLQFYECFLWTKLCGFLKY